MTEGLKRVIIKCSTFKTDIFEKRGALVPCKSQKNTLQGDAGGRYGRALHTAETSTTRFRSP